MEAETRPACLLCLQETRFRSEDAKWEWEGGKGILHKWKWRETQSSVQFSHSVVSDSATPWIPAHQAANTNSQSLPKLTCIELVMLSNHVIFCCKECNQSDFSIALVMSVCRFVSWDVGWLCFLWPMHSFGKTLLAFALLHFSLQGQAFLLLQVSLDFLLTEIFWVPVPCFEKDIFFGIRSRRFCRSS